MTAAVSFTISVTPELAAFVDDKVGSGEYASRSEVARAALRALRRDEPVPERTGSGGRGAERPPAEADTGEDDPWMRRPDLLRHRTAILELAAEAGVDDVRVPHSELSRDPDHEGVVSLLVYDDPRRPYPVLADLAQEIEELFGRTVVIWEEAPPDAPFQPRFPKPSLSLAEAGRSDGGGWDRPLAK